MYQLLLVDDEQNVLNALRRELEDEYEVEAFVSPEAALKRSLEKPFDLVISDYKMPELDGIQFLKQFGKIQPEATRMILSGQADANVLVNAINETHIFRFINKPWDQLEMSGAVTHALAFRNVLLENLKLKRIEPAAQARGGLPQNPDRRYRVLVVDDEANVLSAVVRDLTTRSAFQDWHLFKRHENNPDFQAADSDMRFEIFTTVSPLEALEKAGQFECDVVIADFYMKEMDGIRFLEEFRKIQPDAARIILTGYADKNTLVDAINRLEVFSFINKPWREYDLKTALIQAVTYKNLLQENERLRTAGH